MKSALTAICAELDAIREAGTWREERIIKTPQYARIDTTALRKDLPEIWQEYGKTTTTRRFSVAVAN